LAITHKQENVPICADSLKTLRYIYTHLLTLLPLLSVGEREKGLIFISRTCWRETHWKYDSFF